MHSLIPGYQYDVFISYRQKDNKYDGWVTTFVENLRRELDATFKEDISIYFDANQHDGLHDTHDVDESLKEKLRCVIFIPVVSRTYCDPNSFAWKHELIPFLRLVENDAHGLKVKVNNGNIASRILPIRIHQLEVDDIKLFEKETGSAIRPVDFVFRTSGVNRPLRADEDNPHDNLNKTYYRDQINKVANAINEIVSGLLYEHSTHQNITNDATITGRLEQKKSRSPIKWTWATSIIPLLLIGVLLWNYFRGSNPEVAGPSEKQSIAVIPFKNLNETKENEVICNSLAEDILTHLSGLPDLKVPSRISSNAYRNSEKSAKTISNELGVRYILEGSVLATNVELRITARLIDAEKDEIVWTKPFNRKLEDYFKVQGEVAQSVVSSLRLNLQGHEKDLSQIDQFDIKAYELYKTGLNNLDKGGTLPTLENIIPYFEEALKIDSSLYPAYAEMANAYVKFMSYGRGASKEIYPKVKNALDRCKALNPEYPKLYSALAATALHFDFDLDMYKVYTEMAMRLDPNNPDIYFNEGLYYTIKREFDKAYQAYDKAAELDPAGKPWYNYSKGFSYYVARDYEGAIRAFDESLASDPQYNSALWGKGLTYVQLKEYNKAVETFHRRTAGTYTNWVLANALSKLGNNEEVNKILKYNVDLAKIQYVSPVVLGHLYLAANNKDEACKWFMKEAETLDGGIYWILMVKLDPRMDDMRGHPCYDEIQRRMPL